MNLILPEDHNQGANGSKLSTKKAKTKQKRKNGTTATQQTKETNKRIAPQAEQLPEPHRLTLSGYLRPQSSENYSTPKSFMDKKMQKMIYKMNQWYCSQMQERTLSFLKATQDYAQSPQKISSQHQYSTFNQTDQMENDTSYKTQSLQKSFDRNRSQVAPKPLANERQKPETSVSQSHGGKDSDKKVTSRKRSHNEEGSNSLQPVNHPNNTSEVIDHLSSENLSSNIETTKPSGSKAKKPAKDNDVKPEVEGTSGKFINTSNPLIDPVSKKRIKQCFNNFCKNSQKGLFGDETKGWSRCKVGTKYVHFCNCCAKLLRTNQFCDFCKQVYFDSGIEADMDGKEWVQCSKCEKWNHTECEEAMGKDPEIIRAIKKNAEMMAQLDSDQELDEDQELPYYCLTCRKKRNVAKQLPPTSCGKESTNHVKEELESDGKASVSQSGTKTRKKASDKKQKPSDDQEQDQSQTSPLSQKQVGCQDNFQQIEKFNFNSASQNNHHLNSGSFDDQQSHSQSTSKQLQQPQQKQRESELSSKNKSQQQTQSSKATKSTKAQSQKDKKPVPPQSSMRTRRSLGIVKSNINQSPSLSRKLPRLMNQKSVNNGGNTPIDSDIQDILSSNQADLSDENDPSQTKATFQKDSVPLNNNQDENDQSLADEVESVTLNQNKTSDHPILMQIQENPEIIDSQPMNDKQSKLYNNIDRNLQQSPAIKSAQSNCMDVDSLDGVEAQCSEKMMLAAPAGDSQQSAC